MSMDNEQSAPKVDPEWIDFKSIKETCVVPKTFDRVSDASMTSLENYFFTVMQHQLIGLRNNYSFLPDSLQVMARKIFCNVSDATLYRVSVSNP